MPGCEETADGPAKALLGHRGVAEVPEPSGRASEYPAPADEPTAAAGELTVYPDLLPIAEEDVSCSVCLGVWHKPCVSPCGHVFCFWCIHLAMDGLGPSHCPLCRASYGHLPAICVPLHHLVAQRFPAEARRRAQEVALEEARAGATALTLPPPPPLSVLQAAAFACRCCGALAFEPTVAGCGHVFCHRCLEARAAEETGAVLCPADGCQATIRAVPAACLALGELLRRAAPDAYAARAAVWAPVPRGRLPAGGAPGAAAIRSPPLPPQPFSPIEQMEAAEQDPGYVHFGIICDGCGALPIVGHRWRCADCPERIGFDLCRSCFDRQVHRQVRTGKFNQSHRPHHRIRLVEQAPTWLHRLQAVNPELPVPQLLSLLSLALEGSAEGAGGGRPVEA